MSFARESVIEVLRKSSGLFSGSTSSRLVEMSEWTEFFLSQVGASASLAGLLFVAMSINMKRIVAIPSLPSAALRALSLFVGDFVVSSVMLIPGQTDLVLGSELLVSAAGVSIVICWLSFRVLRLSEQQYRGGSGLGLAAALGVSSFYVAGATFVLAGASIGPYLLVPPALTSILLAVMDSWVLLVEINR